MRPLRQLVLPNRHKLAILARDERGASLMELLVAIVSGVVVMMALFAILNVSLSQTSRVTGRVEADQAGRIAMEKIMNELHSSCVAGYIAPVEAKSDEHQLIFVSESGSQATFSTVHRHVISLQETTPEKFVLTDTAYPSTGSELNYSELSFSAKPSTTTTLLGNAGQSEEKSAPVPVFQYYRYYTTEDKGATIGQLDPTPLKVPLSTEEAKLVAEVAVRFTSKPREGKVSAGNSADLSDTAVLRLSPSDNSSTARNIACA
jgi:type II secretory pathway component PulJ